MGMQRRPSEEPPKKNKDLEHPERFHEVHDPFLFLHRRSQRRANMP
jgi:hypothetical protein